MKIAAIYDIHGNLPALEAVLSDIEQEGVNVIVVGGDTVSGPMPRAAIELLLGLGESVQWIRGNADREVVAAFDGEELNQDWPEEVREITRWTAGQLERRHRNFLAALPEKVSYSLREEDVVREIEGIREVLFCHGSPRSDMEILTVATPEKRLRKVLAGVKEDMIVCGHTHMQFDRMFEGKRVVNAGSVGMPYGEPGAYWLLLDSGVSLRKTRYDLEGAAELVRKSGYPMAEDFAENNVLRPATAQEVVELFEGMAARAEAD